MVTIVPLLVDDVLTAIAQQTPPTVVAQQTPLATVAQQSPPTSVGYLRVPAA
jgi:hypothetical protein